MYFNDDTVILIMSASVLSINIWKLFEHGCLYLQIMKYLVGRKRQKLFAITYLGGAIATV